MPQRVSAAVMVGRDGPLQTLRDGFASLSDSDGRVVVIGGEAGAGKTRLVTEFVVSLGGARVLQGGCLELGEALMPLAPIAGILRQLGRDLGDDRGAEMAGPELAAFLPGGGSGSLDSQWNGQAAMFDSLRSLLERLSSDGPLVLVIEDLHWADRSTLDLVTWLARTLTTVPVLLVLTYRSDEMRRSHPLRAVLAELVRLPQVERVELDPLAEAEVFALLADIHGAPVPAELARQVVDRSEGNPFFAEELLAASGDGGLPLTLRDILAARIDGLGDAAKEVLRIAAAAGRRVDHRLLEVVADLDPEELDAGLRAAVEEQALVADGDGFRFRHALLQEAVHEQLLPGERTRLHRAFAEALLAEPGLAGGGAGAVDAELAHHAAASHDLDLAFASLVRAGDRARSIFAFSEAQHHFEEAVELRSRISEDAATGAPQTWELLRAAAYCAGRSSAPGAGAGYLQRAIGLLDDSVDTVAIGGMYSEMSEALWINGRGDEAIAAIEEAITRLAGSGTREEAEALGWRCRLMLLLGRFEEGLDSGRQGVELARALGADFELSRAENSLGTSLSALGRVDEGLPRLHEAIAIGKRAGLGSDTVRGYINLVSVLKTPLDRVVEAEEQAKAGLSFVREHGVTGAMVDWLRMELADVHVRGGRWAMAAEVLDQVRTGWVSGVNGQYYEISRAYLAVVQGRTDEAEGHLRRALELAPGIRDPQALGPQAGVRMLIGLARGAADWETSIDQLAPLAGDPATYHGLVLTSRAAGAAAVAGDAGAVSSIERMAGILAAQAAKASEVFGAHLAGWRAVVAAELARAEGRSDPDLWSRARDAMVAQCYTEEALYAGMRLAEALAERGRSEEALAVLTATRERADELGALPLAADAETVARRYRLRLPGLAAGRGVAGLTQREREVLALVTLGRTNREIGAELFISEKTASVHVSNILAKLGATNRGEAAAIGRDLGI